MSVVNVTGSNSQFNETQVKPFHPHVGLSDPFSGVLLHSKAVMIIPQDDGLVLHY